MYHVEMINVRETDVLFHYCDDITAKAKNMFNVANYYIRNTMTGISKPKAMRTKNEREVLDIVESMIRKANSHNADRTAKKKEIINSNTNLTDDEKEELIKKLKNAEFKLPTAKKWFLGYGTLDAVFKHSKNVDYRGHHAHVIQNAIKDCVEAWKSYFELQKQFVSDPTSLLGAPKIPHYCKSDHRTAVISNSGCKIKDGQMIFPLSKATIDVTKLPHASRDKLIEVRIKPYFGFYQIQIVTDDGVPTPDDSEDVTISAEDGVMAIDLGLENFATMVDNKGYEPIVIKGGFLKARNQLYNKEMARLRSIQMQGGDPKKKYFPTTKRMRNISRKRDAFFSDSFYKIAHFVFRTMESRGLHTLIVGKNSGWKQDINIGHKNNQEFVQMPFAKFIMVLKTVSRTYGIIVIEQEESYTSKASFLDMDIIPVYKKEAEPVAFSGRRIHRGLYKSGKGIVLNADVNGAANIGRKYSANVFSGLNDFSYMATTVVSVNFNALYKAKK